MILSARGGCSKTSIFMLGRRGGGGGGVRYIGCNIPTQTGDAPELQIRDSGARFQVHQHLQSTNET